MAAQIEILQSDITRLAVDAIVNAANSSLLGGGGVDGAIHHAAGSRLLDECRLLNGCKTGEAKLTAGYKLPSKYVIHTVGPIWHGGSQNEHELLALCYKNSLDLAVKNKIETIAFPAISTGIYRFPKEKAAQIAVNQVVKYLEQAPSLKKVIFVVFDDENYHIYNHIFVESKIKND
jgi:O-acetyl-ADP-ribose deacetylase